jgi:ATP-dependent Lhr-like helicase
VSDFDRLHPALQHHIVNSLGWRELRPFQEAVIAPILAGRHVVILAPTAGGKTEAAFFPVLSRMLSAPWSGLSVLYICPIKALLNNLDQRLQRYCTLLGRRSALWHGDVKSAARRRLLREPPDCLLTTPESLEVMLVSPNVDARNVFQGLHVVVVDEIHAFAGDDRGWHLLAVLERISRLAGREIQRIGLSATVGNPEALLDWLAGRNQGERQIFLPPPAAPAEAEVRLDYVGSLANAAVVIARLHRGEKRLVFVDSRSRAEQLAKELRQLDVTAFVTHSSLSREQRQQAEEAFASRTDCVIVATSVLELGIDVGDLDRVIQIDSPTTVSSLLQRMGRTGRRPGTRRNCLFLATSEDALVRAAALIDLWVEGYVEPVLPSPAPYHILAQQLMALALQEGGIGRRDWLGWIANVPAFAQMPPDAIEHLVTWMLQEKILGEDGGILWLGQEGEKAYGRKNFLDLFSVFSSPPLFTVRHGRQELGLVDETTFLQRSEGPRVLLLGGRAWQVNHIDWQRRVAFVEATEATGRSRWKGQEQALGFRLCQAIKRVLAEADHRAFWSQRARQKLDEVRGQFAWLDRQGTVVVREGDREPQWWTFGGTRANATLAHELSQATQSRVASDSSALTFEPRLVTSTIEHALDTLRSSDAAAMQPAVDERAVHGLKFSECLPPDLAFQVLELRLTDATATRSVLDEAVRFVVAP